MWAEKPSTKPTEAESCGEEGEWKVVGKTKRNGGRKRVDARERHVRGPQRTRRSKTKVVTPNKPKLGLGESQRMELASDSPEDARLARGAKKDQPHDYERYAQYYECAWQPQGIRRDVNLRPMTALEEDTTSALRERKIYLEKLPSFFEETVPLEQRMKWMEEHRTELSYFLYFKHPMRKSSTKWHFCEGVMNPSPRNAELMAPAARLLRAALTVTCDAETCVVELRFTRPEERDAWVGKTVALPHGETMLYATNVFAKPETTMIPAQGAPRVASRADAMAVELHDSVCDVLESTHEVVLTEPRESPLMKAKTTTETKMKRTDQQHHAEEASERRAFLRGNKTALPSRSVTSRKEGPAVGEGMNQSAEGTPSHELLGAYAVEGSRTPGNLNEGSMAERVHADDAADVQATLREAHHQQADHLQTPGGLAPVWSGAQAQAKHSPTDLTAVCEAITVVMRWFCELDSTREGHTTVVGERRADVVAPASADKQLATPPFADILHESLAKWLQHHKADARDHVNMARLVACHLRMMSPTCRVDDSRRTVAHLVGSCTRVGRFGGTQGTWTGAHRAEVRRPPRTAPLIASRC